MDVSSVPMEEIYSPSEVGSAHEVLPGSPDVRQLRHPSLGLWTGFRKNLRPRYGVVWFDISFCLLMMAGGFAALRASIIWAINVSNLKPGVLFELWIGVLAMNAIDFRPRGRALQFVAEPGPERCPGRLDDMAVFSRNHQELPPKPLAASFALG